MPIEYSEEVAKLTGKCTIDETSAFYEWLLLHPEGQVDLRHCEHLHMSLVQLLVASKRGLSQEPENRFLQHLLPYLR